MMEVIQSQIQSQGSKLIIDQVIKLQSISDFQSDFFFGARIARRDIVRLWRVCEYVSLLRRPLTPPFARLANLCLLASVFKDASCVPAR